MLRKVGQAEAALGTQLQGAKGRSRSVWEREAAPPSVEVGHGFIDLMKVKERTKAAPLRKRRVLAGDGVPRQGEVCSDQI